MKYQNPVIKHDSFPVSGLCRLKQPCVSSGRRVPVTAPRLSSSCYMEAPRPWGCTSRGPSVLWVIFWVSAPDLCRAYSKCSTYKYVANLLIKGHWIFFNVQETPEFRIWIWPVKALGWPCSGLCTCLQHDLFFLKMVRTQMCTAKTKTEYP